MVSVVSAVGVAALFVLGVGLAHLRIVPPLAGFGMFTLSGAIGLIVLAGVAIGRMRGTSNSLLHDAAIVVVCLMPVVLLIAGASRVLRYPRINDVTTDIEDPPAFHAIAALPENRSRTLVFPDDFRDAIRTAYPDLEPLVESGTEENADRDIIAARDLAKNRKGWKIVNVDPATRSLECVVESTAFRFRDYVVVRVTYENHRIRIDMRSKSRDGKSDLGVNAHRIESFLDALQRTIAGQNRSARNSGTASGGDIDYKRGIWYTCYEFWRKAPEVKERSC